MRCINGIKVRVYVGWVERIAKPGNLKKPGFVAHLTQPTKAFRLNLMAVTRCVGTRKK